MMADFMNALRRFFGSQNRFERTKHPSSHYHRPRLEVLEDRVVPTTQVLATMVPGYGVYMYSNDQTVAPFGWHKLTSAWASSVSVSRENDAGVNTVAVVASLPGYGTYAYTPIRGWQQLTPAVASRVAVEGVYVAADFPGYGTYLYNDTPGVGRWSRLSPVDASQLAVNASGEVVGDFYNYGVHEWTSTSGWHQISPAVASQLAIDDSGDVLGEFPGYGVHLYEPPGRGSGWSTLTKVDATSIAMDTSGDTAASFSPWGTYYFDGNPSNPSWTKLSSAVASQVNLDQDGDLIGEFSGYGIHLWLTATHSWFETLTKADASLMATARSS